MAGPEPTVTWEAPQAPGPLPPAVTPPPFPGGMTAAVPQGRYYKPAGTLARAAAWLIGISAALHAVDLLWSFYGIGLVSDLENTTEQELLRFDAVFGLVALGILASFLAAAVAYWAWSRRLVANVPALAGGEPNHSPNSAVWWWFIPFANFVKPYQIIADVWRRLATTLHGERANLVVAWWVTYIVGNIVGTIYARLPAAETVEEFNGQMSLNIAADALTVVAGVLAVRMILELEKRSTTRAAAIVAAYQAAQLAAEAAEDDDLDLALPGGIIPGAAGAPVELPADAQSA